MNDWVRHPLDEMIVKKYLDYSVRSANVLSDAILQVDFKKGSFFTFLPRGINLNSIINLSWSLNCPPEEKYSDSDILPGMSIAAQFILMKMKLHPQLNCLFDDVSMSPHYPFFQKNVDEFYMRYQEEIYYFICNNQSLSFDLIVKYLRKSNAVWHSIIILTEATLDYQQKEVEMSYFKKACETVELILFIAFDSDAYLYWERSI